eukprot:1143405-Lingulodinium_polyedra.AAC.1
MPEARHGYKGRPASILTQISDRFCIIRPRGRDDDQHENGQTCGRHYDDRQEEASRRIRLTC